jgi:electron transport complex protein RnfC
VHYFNYAKGMLNDQDRERRKNERVKTLVESRIIRIEKVAEAKKAALAAKKPAAAPAATESPTAAPAPTAPAPTAEEKANA